MLLEDFFLPPTAPTPHGTLFRSKYLCYVGFGKAQVVTIWEIVCVS